MDNRMKSSTATRALRKPLVWWIAIILTIPFALQAQNKYVGAKKCATCHNTGKEGNPFHVWQTSMHAGAFRTLADMSANKDERHDLWIIKMGRGDRYGLPTPATESKYCLPCHATAFGADAQFTALSFDLKDGVQCESCHGPASAHAEVESIKAKRQAIPVDEVAGALEIAKTAVLKRYADEGKSRLNARPDTMDCAEISTLLKCGQRSNMPRPQPVRITQREAQPIRKSPADRRTQPLKLFPLDFSISWKKCLVSCNDITCNKIMKRVFCIV